MNFTISEDTCVICCDDIIKDNVVFYKLDECWKQYSFCSNCTKTLITRKWYDYIESIKKADCEKELKGLLKQRLLNNLTIDSTINTRPIDELYFDDSSKSSILDKHQNLNFDDLSDNLYELYNNIMTDPTYDYINRIKIIMKNHDLN